MEIDREKLEADFKAVQLTPQELTKFFRASIAGLFYYFSNILQCVALFLFVFRVHQQTNTSSMIPITLLMISSVIGVFLGLSYIWQLLNTNFVKIGMPLKPAFKLSLLKACVTLGILFSLSNLLVKSDDTLSAIMLLLIIVESILFSFVQWILIIGWQWIGSFYCHRSLETMSWTNLLLIAFPILTVVTIILSNDDLSTISLSLYLLINIRCVTLLINDYYRLSESPLKTTEPSAQKPTDDPFAD
jgi:hypothetical protein